MFHLVFMYLVFLFDSRPPDKVQAIGREQESGARLVILNLFANLFYVGKGNGLEWIREIDNLIVWIECVRSHVRLISDYESIVTQTLRRALEAHTLNDVKRRNLYFVQVLHRLSLAVPEANQFC